MEERIEDQRLKTGEKGPGILFSPSGLYVRNTRVGPSIPFLLLRRRKRNFYGGGGDGKIRAIPRRRKGIE